MRALMGPLSKNILVPKKPRQVGCRLQLRLKVTQGYPGPSMSWEFKKARMAYVATIRTGIHILGLFSSNSTYIFVYLFRDRTLATS